MDNQRSAGGQELQPSEVYSSTTWSGRGPDLASQTAAATGSAAIRPRAIKGFMGLGRADKAAPYTAALPRIQHRSLDKILLQIAAELSVRPAQVKAAVELLDGGATVPFIARYRKEATDGLDDTQLRDLEARLAYLRELEDRRAAVIKSVEEQGKLTPALRAAFEAAPTKQELEDLYLPFKQKRRTKGMIAREAGLEPLADKLFADPSLEPLAEAAAFINAEGGFADAHAVLDGVRDLLSERWAEDAALIGTLRSWLWAEGRLQSRLAAGKDGQHADAAKFRDYFEYDEPLHKIPSHRALAVFRGRSLEWLDAKLVLDEEIVPGQPSLAEGRIAHHLGWRHGKRPGRRADPQDHRLDLEGQAQPEPGA